MRILELLLLLQLHPQSLCLQQSWRGELKKECNFIVLTQADIPHPLLWCCSLKLISPELLFETYSQIGCINRSHLHVTEVIKDQMALVSFCILETCFHFGQTMSVRTESLGL